MTVWIIIISCLFSMHEDSHSFQWFRFQVRDSGLDFLFGHLSIFQDAFKVPFIGLSFSLFLFEECSWNWLELAGIWVGIDKKWSNIDRILRKKSKSTDYGF